MASIYAKARRKNLSERDRNHLAFLAAAIKKETRA